MIAEGCERYQSAPKGAKSRGSRTALGHHHQSHCITAQAIKHTLARRAHPSLWPDGPKLLHTHTGPPDVEATTSICT
eukprot:482807-Amphidinium_carterae.1